MRIVWSAVLLIFSVACSDPRGADNQRLSVRQTMAGIDDSYSRVEGPRQWKFPEDHGPHPNYKSEWWYFTGNLTAEDNREFGYQFTIFRQGIGKGLENIESVFSSKEVYLLHFVITDIENGSVYSYENFARADDTLFAGANSKEVWIDSSKVTIGPEKWEIFGKGNDFSLDLDLLPFSEIILQGDNGYSRKGQSSFNASYYYTIPRWKSSGEVCIKNKRCYQVTGLSWLDREFSTSALDTGQVGWDWFSIQLETGENLMLYQMRRDDGSIDVHSHGYFQSIDTKKSLGTEDYSLKPLSFKRQKSGALVPVKWQVKVLEKEFIVQAKLEDHELPFSISYWEGPISVICADRKCGQGYLEMTGYNLP